jgi:hypothetical protein
MLRSIHCDRKPLLNKGVSMDSVTMCRLLTAHSMSVFVDLGEPLPANVAAESFCRIGQSWNGILGLQMLMMVIPKCFFVFSMLKVKETLKMNKSRLAVLAQSLFLLLYQAFNIHVCYHMLHGWLNDTLKVFGPLKLKTSKYRTAC